MNKITLLLSLLTITGKLCAQNTCAAPVALSNADLPFSSPGFGLPGELTTCGTNADYTSADVNAHGNSNENGEDFVFSFVPTSTVAVDVDLYYNGTAVSLFIYKGCPTDATGFPQDRDTGGNPRQLPGMTFEKDSTYFIIISDNSSCAAFQLDITETTTTSGSHSIDPETFVSPYSQVDFTTCGQVDYYDQGSLGMNGCGSSTECSYTQDEEHIFSVDAVADEIITVEIPDATIHNAGQDPGIYILDGIPEVPSTTVVSSKFTINSSGETEGVTLTDTFTTAGTYYIMVGTKGSPNCATFDLNITTTAPVLPIELVDFSVRESHQGASIQWTTLTETNNDFFTIQRSKNGKEWTDLFHINGAGNSSEKIHYQVNDPYPFPGKSYYRLKQTDFDQRHENFGVYSLNNTQGNPELNIWPNPNDGTKFRVEITQSERNSQILVSVEDLFGSSIFEERQVSNDDAIFRFNISPDKRIKSGTYILKVQNEKFNLAQKMVVK